MGRKSVLYGAAYGIWGCMGLYIGLYGAVYGAVYGVSHLPSRELAQEVGAAVGGAEAEVRRGAAQAELSAAVLRRDLSLERAPVVGVRVQRLPYRGVWGQLRECMGLYGVIWGQMGCMGSEEQRRRS